jgi:glycosyltransferase involved in cell wall biosynthesis
MKILFTTAALTIGGIEVLALRLCEAFGRAGHEITLYDFNPHQRSEQLVSQYDTSLFKIAGLAPGPVADWLLWKANAVLFKTGLVKNGWRQQLIERHFAQFLVEHDFDVICSLSFHQDYLACKYAARKNTPVVVSMHGTYEYASPAWAARARSTYEYTKAIIYVADKNLAWYEKQAYFDASKPTYKIYTGLDLKRPIPATITRASLGLADSTFVYVMVARGIKEKGWHEAIKAFLQLAVKWLDTALVLVGDGEEVQQLKTQYGHEKAIIFYGTYPNPLELDQLANVGLLPTYFSIESLPSSIMEYLQCGLPVISTEIGEIPTMLQLADGRNSGHILPLPGQGQGVDVIALAEAMAQYVADPAYYSIQRQLARQAARKFDVADSVVSYTRIFAEVLNK